MTYLIQAIYPFFVCVWVIAHFVTNRWGSQYFRRYYSTKIALDDEIPFIPNMAVVYFSGFILGNMAYFFFGSTEKFPNIAVGYGAQFIVSISFYALYPCRADRREDFIPTNASSHLLLLFQRISKPFNAFPSMHTSYCLFSALSVWGYSSSTTYILMMAWAVLVALSTLLTKQHHIVDVIAGAILGVGSYAITVKLT